MIFDLMPPETYQLLHETSIARVEGQWHLTDSQRCVMRTMSLLSFAEGQSWALIPCQARLAVALRLNKGTVSRALRACIAMGILERLERQHETLYRVRPNAEGVPLRGDDESARALAELQALQRRRLQGTAEASGQIRLPGILPSEELDAPADAFEAAISMSPTRTENPVALSDLPGRDAPLVDGAGDEESDQSFQARLEALARAGPPTVATAATVPPLRSDWMPEGKEKRDARFAEGSRGLDAEQLRVMRELRSECRATNQQSEDDFLKFVFRWRREVMEQPSMIDEIIAKHAALRRIGQGYKITGKFVDATLRRMGRGAVKVDSS